MKTNKPHKWHAGKKRKTKAIANAMVGAVVGGVIAGPVGAIAGAAVGALVEKGPPTRKSATGVKRRSKPTKETPIAGDHADGPSVSKAIERGLMKRTPHCEIVSETREPRRFLENKSRRTKKHNERH